MIGGRGITFILAATLCLGGSAASAAGSVPVTLVVNGTDLTATVPPELQNGTVTAPVRPIAEALGAHVHWDGTNRTVTITSNSLLTKQQVADLIATQGREKDYYMEGLSFQTADLDGDNDQEIIAVIDGGVHLGNFFIFDQTTDGNYTLIKEESWKVEKLALNGIEIAGKNMFETVQRTGGTGLDTYIAHLWYMDDGKVVEAWQGVLKETNAMVAGSYSLTLGSYQIDAQANVLYSWESKCKLDEETVETIGDPETVVNKYTFDGTRFVSE